MNDNQGQQPRMILLSKIKALLGDDETERRLKAGEFGPVYPMGRGEYVCVRIIIAPGLSPASPTPSPLN